MEDSKLIKKLKAGEDLTQEERDYLAKVLDNPLKKFCEKESEFRLSEYFELEDRDVDKFKDDVTTVIFEAINDCDPLYDYIDAKIEEYLEEHK